MKNTALSLSDESWNALRKFLARADLKGHEVPEFTRLLQELERCRTVAAKPVSGESRPA